MLRFNVQTIAMAKQRDTNFNTSYVKVQPVNPFSHIFTLSNFNTSYVKVQPGNSLSIAASYRYFNTSYVKVQPYAYEGV